MSKIFISHSSRDNAKALAVGTWLKDNGWNEYFLDITPTQGLTPGERWQEALKKAADRCEVVLFLISPAWRDSTWCLAEFLLAKQLGKRIFGVLIEPTPLDSLPKEMTIEWQLADLIEGNKRTTITVHHDPLVHETTVSFAEAGLALLKQGLQKAGLDPTHFDWPPAHDSKRAPYRGLKALEAEDAAIFFGRDAAIVRGLDKLRLMRDEGVERLFIILGASGAGKSSYLRAGLWPRLARDDRHFFPLPVIRPENHVITGPTGLIASLETAFEQVGQEKNRGDLRKTLESPGAFDQLLIELQALAQTKLVAEAEPPTLILSIDQGEELFGADGREESEHFLTLLGSTLSPPAGDPKSAQTARRRILGIIAIRSDSYDRLQTAPTLAAAKHNPFNLKPIAREDFKTVIEGPAKVITNTGRNLTIDPNLTEQLLADTTGADALPLLAFTLERLYLDYGKDGDLRLDEYEKLGGVRGSIEAAVTNALSNPDHPPAIPRDPAIRDEHLRQIFIPWLAGIDPETSVAKRRVACREELQEKLPADAQPLIDRLIQARLLTQDQRTVDTRQGITTIIEVAHEALLRQWLTLTKWLDQDSEQLKTTEMVRRGAAEWDKKGRGDEWLDLRGERLKAAEALRQRPDLWSLLAQQGQDYIAKCRGKEDQARAEREAHLKKTARMQSRIWKLMTAVTLVLVAGIVGVTLQTREIGRQTSLVLATAAQTASDAGHVDRALRFAVLATISTWLTPTSIEAEPQLARSAHASTMQVLLSHDDQVNSGTFSPDGTKVITASDDKTARVWDATTGKELARLTHENPVRSAIVTTDGTRVVTLSEVSSDPWSYNGISSNDETVRVWDMATGKVLVQLTHDGIVRSAIVTGDGTKVITISDDKDARVWDVATGKELARFPHRYPIWSATITADGTKVVTASDDKTAWVWDVATRKELARFPHRYPISSVTVTADGTKVVTASDDKTARVWDVATRKELARFPHEESVESVAITADGTRVVTTSDDKTARVWNVATGKELARFVHEDSVEVAIVTADGTKVVTTSDNKTIQVWDVATSRELAQLSHEYRVRSFTITGDGTRVVTTSDDKTTRVWNVAISKELARFVHEKPVESATITADSTRIVTVSKDKTARVWDVVTGKELARFPHEKPVESATNDVLYSKVFQSLDEVSGDKWVIEMIAVWSPTISANGTRVVTTSDDKTAQVWDVTTAKELARFPHKNPIESATIIADGTRVVTALDDKTAQVWDVATGKEQVRFVHDEPIESVTITADGTKVLTTSDDKTARVWDVVTGKELARLVHQDFVRSATITADGSKVVTTSLNRWTTHTADPFRTVQSATVQVWDMATGKELAEFTQKGTLQSAIATADGTRVITTSHDKAAQVWDMATGKELARFVHESSVQSASISTDNTKVVTSSNDTSARIWDAHWLIQYHGQELIQRVCREKLIGASHITARDIEISPILSGRKGEDVCDPPSLFSRLRKSLGFGSW